MIQTTTEITEQGYYEECAPVQHSTTRYAVSKCIFSENTDYAHTVIIDNPDYGRMLFLDKELQSCSYDEKIYHETLVHPALNSLKGDENNILVIGGAEGATVREVLKWKRKIKNIDWVDIDKKLVNVCKEHLQYAEPKIYSTNESVKFYAQDIMVFLENCTGTKYNCIIIDLPDPDPLVNNSLYGSLFWTLIKNVSSSDGIIVTHTGPVEPGYGRQPGLDFIIKGAFDVGFENGKAYHTYIPSFQSEWGFWIYGSSIREFSTKMISKFNVMDSEYQKTIFHWDRHWQLSTGQ